MKSKAIALNHNVIRPIEMQSDYIPNFILLLPPKRSVGAPTVGYNFSCQTRSYILISAKHRHALIQKYSMVTEWYFTILNDGGGWQTMIDLYSHIILYIFLINKRKGGG